MFLLLTSLAIVNKWNYERLWKSSSKSACTIRVLTTLWSMSKLVLKIIFLGMILWKLVIFIKILILGLRIFKSQNLLFFFKNKNFQFVEKYLWENDSLLTKRKQRIQNHHLKVHREWKCESYCFPDNYFWGGIVHTQESMVHFIEEKDTIHIAKRKVIHPWKLVFLH